MQLLRLVQSHRPELTFPVFWEKYPRRDGKRDAVKAWTKLDPDEGLVAQIIASLEWQSYLWVAVERREPRFILLPATYIRGERWNDSKPSGLHLPKPVSTELAPAVREQMAYAERRDQLMAQGLSKAEALNQIDRERDGDHADE